MENIPALEELVALVEQRAPTDEPLTQLTEAVLVSGHMDELRDSLVGHFVSRAREAGATWEEIGECMGTTKQAAQKRFAHRRQRRRGGFFHKRFTEEARRVVQGAVTLAREMGGDEVNPNHLLVNIMDQPVIARAIGALGGSVDEIRSTIRSALESVRGGEPTDAHVPFSFESKKVLELSLREAIHAGDRQISVEHIFLGILREGASQGAQVLARAGITRKAFESWLESQD